jgi:hypothetical protein
MNYKVVALDESYNFRITFISIHEHERNLFFNMLSKEEIFVLVI